MATIAQKPGPVRDDDDTVRKIPLRNMKREVVGYAYVDASDFEKVNASKWHRAVYESNVYARSDVFLHKFILGDPPEDHVIDHWNGDGLDNRRCNLRFACRSTNSHNKKKQKGASSKFFGVSKCGKLWSAQLKGLKLGTYRIEIHAAYAYDLAAIECYGENANINGVAKPEGWKPAETRYAGEKGVTKANNKYLAKFRNPRTKELERIGLFVTREEARAAYQKREKQFLAEDKIFRRNMAITRDDEGHAYVMAGETRVVVSDEDWHTVKERIWSFSRYASTNIGRTSVRMHQFIMGKRKGYRIDHINGNKRDNRRCNLRWATASENGQNARPIWRNNKYKGYQKQGDKFSARIVKDKQYHGLGTYPTESLAALAYNHAARHFYGTHAYQNDVPEDAGYAWDAAKMRLVPKLAEA